MEEKDLQGVEVYPKDNSYTIIVDSLNKEEIGKSACISQEKYTDKEAERRQKYFEAFGEELTITDGYAATGPNWDEWGSSFKIVSKPYKVKEVCPWDLEKEYEFINVISNQTGKIYRTLFGEELFEPYKYETFSKKDKKN